jgi:acyl-CoA reductase-like NAD-dependent aldehyde dehydrogenase
VIVDETANVRNAAEVMLWGKLTNCGQICVAPDHVFVHESVKERFVAECRKVLAERWRHARGATCLPRPDGRDQPASHSALRGCCKTPWPRAHAS